jgi:predicted nucleic acid-binding protein
LTAYLDTSALAKWYVAEPGSDRFSAYLADIPDAVISRLTIVEMRCLLARRRRSGLLSAHLEALAYARFTEQIAAGYLRVEPMPDARLLEALGLIERMPAIPLRTLDALHLAVAQAAAATTVATADAIMRQAANALGLDVAFFGSEPP